MFGRTLQSRHEEWGVYVVEEVAVLIDEGVAEALLYTPQQLLELRCPFLGKGFAVEAQGIIPQGMTSTR